MVRARAFFKLTSGYTPSDTRFSFPAKRYLRRHHLPRRGETSRYRPSRSNIRTVLAAGLAFRAMLSVSGIWGQLQLGFGQLPPVAPSCPRKSTAGCVALRTPKGIKKPAFYAGFVEVLGCLRKSSEDLN